MTLDPLRIVLVTNDLMASSQIEGQARSAGYSVISRGSVGKAIEYAAANPVKAIVAEVMQEGMDVAALVALGVPVFAYASHVREAELQAAAAAGATPLSRGQAASQLGALLRQLNTAPH